MLVTRRNLMEKIRQAEDVNSIRSVMSDTIRRMADHGTHPHLINRFLLRFEGDLTFELRQKNSQREEVNLAEALHLLSKREI
jgi:hypothetical protein